MKMPPAFSSFKLVALKGIMLFFSFRKLTDFNQMKDIVHTFFRTGQSGSR